MKGVTMKIPVIDVPMTGAKIDLLRKKANLSVKDIQKVFGFENPQAIYKWLNGRNLPTVDNLIILANIFNVNVEDILSIRYVDIKKEVNEYS